MRASRLWMLAVLLMTASCGTTCTFGVAPPLPEPPVLSFACPVSAKAGEPLVFRVFSPNARDIDKGHWSIRNLNGELLGPHQAVGSEFHIGFSDPVVRVVEYELRGEKVQCTVHVK